MNTACVSLCSQQTQSSADSNTTYDLFIVVNLGGLQHRKYLIKFSEKPGKEGSSTHHAWVVSFKRLNVSQELKTGRRLLPVLNECYKIMLDQDTNLLHSITDR